MELESKAKVPRGHKAKATRLEISGDGAQAKITMVPSGVTNKQGTNYIHTKKKTNCRSTSCSGQHPRVLEMQVAGDPVGTSRLLLGKALRKDQHQTMTPHDFSSLRMFQTVTCYNVPDSAR